jgi:hypothetical protein
MVRQVTGSSDMTRPESPLREPPATRMPATVSKHPPRLVPFWSRGLTATVPRPRAPDAATSPQRPAGRCPIGLLAFHFGTLAGGPLGGTNRLSAEHSSVNGRENLAQNLAQRRAQPEQKGGGEAAQNHAARRALKTHTRVL